MAAIQSSTAFRKEKDNPGFTEGEITSAVILEDNCFPKYYKKIKGSFFLFSSSLFCCCSCGMKMELHQSSGFQDSSSLKHS